MEIKALIRKSVKKYYQKDKVNCATANLKILAEQFNIQLDKQVISAAVGMHGAGKYGAQCGLVEGTLMFLGILGEELNITDDKISNACHAYAIAFVKQFSSLQCNVLRPDGFKKDDPPHLCMDITERAILFNLEFIRSSLT